MRLPQTPPDWQDAWFHLVGGPGRIEQLLQAKLDDRYLHWDELRRRPPPSGLTHEEWWSFLKFRRLTLTKTLETPGPAFSLATPDAALEMLRVVDQQGGGQVGIGLKHLDEPGRRRFVMSALREEAIESSLLEGAATSRRVAKEMLRTGRKPETVGERMILNNFEGMQFVSERRHVDVSGEGLSTLHGVLTRDTLRSRDVEGRFQTASDERVYVIDRRDNTVLHTPPSADTISDQIDALCAFANGNAGPDWWIHPVARAIVCHFWLAWLHPFDDWNGRTARALFYWVMLRNDYWVAEYLPISRLFRAAPAKYSRAFLHVESDDHDVTYFVLYHLRVLLRALEDFHAYVARKVSEIRETERHLKIRGLLNHRQVALIQHALRHDGAQYTVQGHQASHGVAYATARSDLLDLVDRGVLLKRKQGRRFVFSAADDLAATLESLTDGPT